MKNKFCRNERSGAKPLAQIILSRQRLQRITDWPAWVHAAKYCVATLARNCRVSVRTLERHIKRAFGQCVHDWLSEGRMQRAVKLLGEEHSVKETAFELCYKHPHHFSRDFKKHFGYCPTQTSVSSQIRSLRLN